MPKFQAVNAYKNMPVQAKAGFWFVICNILVRGIAFITTPLFTRLIPQAQYGDLSVYLSSTNIVLIISSWDISYGAYLKGLYKYEDMESFTKVTQLFVTVSTVIVLGILYALYPIIGEWLSIPLSFYPVLFFYLLMEPSYRNWMAYKQKEYAYKWLVPVSLAFSILTTIIPFFAVLFIENSANVKYVSQQLAAISVFFVFYIKNADIRSVLLDKSKLKEQLKYIILFQLPCVVHSLSLVILSQADRIMIKNMVGGEAAALYSVAYSVGMVLTVIESGLDNALNPWRYELMKKKDYAKIDRITMLMLIILGVCLCLFMLVAPELYKLVFPVSYYDAIGCLPPMTISIYFIALYATFVSIEGYFEETKYLMYIAVACSVMNIIMNYIVIQIWNYKACAYTTMVTYLLFCVLHYFAMNKVLKNYFEDKILSTKRIVMISFLVCGFTLAMIVLYDHIILRYFVFVIIVFVIIAERKKFDDLVSIIRRGKRISND